MGEARGLRTYQEHLEAMAGAAKAEVLALRSQLDQAMDALKAIAEFGGGDGGDWLPCCEMARETLAALNKEETADGDV